MHLQLTRLALSLGALLVVAGEAENSSDLDMPDGTTSSRFRFKDY